jgi:hypothetical protein
MSIYIWSVLVVAALGIGLFVVALCHAAGKLAPMPSGPVKLYPWWLGGEKPAEAAVVPAKAKRVYIRGLCVYCGEVAVLRADGEPHARFHSCPGMTQTVTTWPPAPADQSRRRLHEIR